MDKFDSLNDKFLGDGNASGIPSIKADHFANNIYRLINAIDYLGRPQKVEVERDEELKLSLDIRTLIFNDKRFKN